MESRSFSGTVGDLSGRIRLDRYAAETLGLHRSQIKTRLLEAKLNGKPVKFSRPVKTGDRVELCWLPAAPLYLKPEPIPLTIIYEDQRCVVINKSQGMVVHPGAGNHSGTLANALLWRRLYHEEKGQTNRLDQPDMLDHLTDYRNGIVHRLDKDTSGVIIAAYDDEALEELSAQFRAGTVRKQYLAIVEGTPTETEGRILSRLIRDPRDRKRFTAIPVEAAKSPGKTALTKYRLLKSWGDYTLLLLKPRTGRTHQLRVQLKYLGHPILGDPVYNPRYEPGRTRRGISGASLMLHAFSLAIVLPGKSERLCFRAPLPEHFKKIMTTLKCR